VDASVGIEGTDRAGLERLLRYCARPRFALEHLQQLDAEHLLYHCPKPRPDGPSELVLTPLELIDRIGATRSAISLNWGMPQLRIGDWLVDRATNEICRNSELVHLEPKVIDLLIALAQHADQVVSREELLAQVWSGVVVSEDVLTQGVIKLRKALGDNSKEPVYIQTIPKNGVTD